jgi:hypothetical protein
MKRPFLVLCVGSAVVLLGLIIFRVLTKKAPAPSQQQAAQAIQVVVDSFSKVKTQPLSLRQFSEVVEQRGASNLNSLSAVERRKLLACITQFYACYSSGDFEEFKKFRMRPPFKVGERLAAAAKETASQKGVELRSDEDVLRFAWNQWSGTNRIGGVSQESITLSSAQRSDLGIPLRQPSGGKFPGSGASCWEGALTYQPSPDELLKKDGALRYFTLEVSVRFNTYEYGPATPLLLMGYWDSTREDWMPLCLCTVFQVHNYDTIF